MRLEDITPNLALTGLEPNAVVTVLAVNRRFNVNQAGHRQAKGVKRTVMENAGSLGFKYRDWE